VKDSNRIVHRFGVALALALTAAIGSVTALQAHDVWIVPNARPVSSGGRLEVPGPSGTRFQTTDSAAVVGVIERFHAALAAGDSGAALALLAPDVAIVEGRIESLADYRSGHLRADIAYARAVTSTREVRSVRIQGDVAWVLSRSRTQGEFRGRQINSTGVELVMLVRDGAGWKIRAVHWTSGQG